VLGAHHVADGDVVLVEGDEETPSPNASTATAKNRVVSTSLSGPKNWYKSSLRPLYQVGTRITFDPSALSRPQVR
jgi:hypothetical protein